MHHGSHMDFLVYMVGVLHILLFFNIVFDYIESALHLGFEEDKLVDEFQILKTGDDEIMY